MTMTTKDQFVLLTAEQLRELVADAVGVALAKAGARDAPSEILTREDTAKLIGVSTASIPKLVRVDGLPTLRRVGPEWRFRRSEVLSWLSQRKTA